jgi:hypothetical protein
MNNITMRNAVILCYLVLCYLVNGVESWLKEALEKGVNPDIRCNDDGETLLHTAAKKGYLNKARLHLQYGVSPNVRTRRGETPLHYAVKTGSLEVTRILVDRGAYVDARDADGQTPLHYAAERGFISIAKLLLERGADPNAEDNEGDTSLHESAPKCFADVAEVLLNHGANLFWTNKKGKTPMDLASKNGCKVFLMAVEDPLRGKVVSSDEIFTVGERVLGKYVIKRKLSSGYMTVAYLADDGERDVVVKVPSMWYHEDLPINMCVHMLKSEILGRIWKQYGGHPNIVKFVDWGSERRYPVLVEEYLPGQTLAEYAASKGGLDPDEAFEIGRKLADVLRFLHSHGIIHSYLAADNVIIREADKEPVVDLGHRRILRPDNK